MQGCEPRVYIHSRVGVHMVEYCLVVGELTIRVLRPHELEIIADGHQDVARTCNHSRDLSIAGMYIQRQTEYLHARKSDAFFLCFII